MAGTIIMIVLLVIAMPVAILISGAVGAALLGGLVNLDNDRSHEGTELYDLTYPDRDAAAN